MTITLDILDEILEQVPTNGAGRRNLMACALVATWWTGPSQRRLFSSVRIDDRNYERWMNGVVLSGSKTHLLQYVRSLWHSRSHIGTMYQMRDLAQDSGEYFSALKNLRTLTLFNTRVEKIDEDQFHTCFSAFRETLTYLSLDSFTTSFSAFVTLLDYFPNITTLQIRSFTLEPDEGPVPPLSRPLRGKVHIHRIQSSSLEFLNQFSKLDLEYEELIIDSPSFFMDAKFVESALKISANTVKFLRLTAALYSEPAVTICDFRRLRELELMMIRPRSSHWVLLSSITSTELRKIIFPAKYRQDRKIFPQRVEEWALVDKQLCRLLDRLHATGYCRTLEVELRLMGIEGDPEDYDLTTFLPEFREKGAVTIKDVGDD